MLQYKVHKKEEDETTTMTAVELMQMLPDYGFWDEEWDAVIMLEYGETFSNDILSITLLTEEEAKHV